MHFTIFSNAKRLKVLVFEKMRVLSSLLSVAVLLRTISEFLKSSSTVVVALVFQDALLVVASALALTCLVICAESNGPPPPSAPALRT
jgi:hypothetical protein